MRKIFLGALALIASLITLTSCEKERTSAVIFNDLPSAAQSTITTHFNREDITLISFDNEIFDKEYTITFNDGTQLEFNKAGEWTKVDSKVSGVPTSLIPSKIVDYLNNNYFGEKVTELEKDGKNYDLTINDITDLTFNSEGVLIEIDLD